MPPRYPPDYCVTGGGRQETCGVNWSCPGTFCFDAYGHVPIQPEMRKGSLNSRSRSKSASNRSRSCNDNCDHKCCRGPSGDLAEGISIRKDMYFLEQMFIRAHELRKIHDYYNKVRMKFNFIGHTNYDELITNDFLHVASKFGNVYVDATS